MDRINDRSWRLLFPRLDESQQRWFAALKAEEHGRGGIAYVHRASGLSAETIRRGLAELRDPRRLPPPGRVRRTGGGRKRVERLDPAVLRSIEDLLGETTAGDPMCALKWTLKSSRTLAAELQKRGHSLQADTVRRILHGLGYTLQANEKSKEGGDHPDRDSQFRYINRQVGEFQARGDPVISVDGKKKEQVGDFKNPGQQWKPKGKSRKVNAYNFPSLAVGVATLYGAFDISRNEGWVNVGTNHETAEFAVESIGQWWRRLGQHHYPKAKRLLICADGGGSNASRSRLWKVHLQRLCDDTGLAVTVCHYPPGTSKWNKIEHRMFSFISMNWRGVPLETYETVINLISSTTTRKGLRVNADLDKRFYETGIEITDEMLRALKLQGHAVHPRWNYTIEPRG